MRRGVVGRALRCRRLSRLLLLVKRFDCLTKDTDAVYDNKSTVFTEGDGSMKERGRMTRNGATLGVLGMRGMCLGLSPWRRRLWLRKSPSYTFASVAETVLLPTHVI
jgi:hypothetical protein